MAGVLIKGEIWKWTHTRRTPCEDEGREPGDDFVSQDMTKTASKPPGRASPSQPWKESTLPAPSNH